MIVSNFVRHATLIIASAFVIACGTSKKTPQANTFTNNNTNTSMATKPVLPQPNGITDATLQQLIEQDTYLNTIASNKTQYQVQILFTQINRNSSNEPKFTTYHYNTDPNFYFYPASMVKLPVVMLALQKIKELNAQGIAITKETTMITEASNLSYKPAYNDATTPDGKPTIAHYIKKVLLVSDNDAYNRLYEFCGQEYINNNLQQLGYKGIEILHRVETGLNFEENKTTNPINFYDGNNNIIYAQLAATNKKKYSNRTDLRGVGYIKNGKLINEAFDFSKKNRYNLNEMHNTISSIVFGQGIDKRKPFNITDADKQFVLQYMSQLPRETTYPTYPLPTYYDGYCKFHLYGSTKTNIPNNLRIFNKVGDAYGYISDAGYVVDFATGTEFMLSSTIYVNKDGVFNDDTYEMESIALPFMQRLGQLLLQYEQKRKKQVMPNLDYLKLTYDK